MEAQKAIDILADHLLGKDWYITDPVSVSQANQIIVEEIVSRYEAVDADPVEKYRRKHKKCKWCGYCTSDVQTSIDETGMISHKTCYECKAKEKRVNHNLLRPFCSCFKLRKENDI